MLTYAGKTLLAKAMSGEANVPFLSMSGMHTSAYVSIRQHTYAMSWEANVPFPSMSGMLTYAAVC